MKTCSLIILLLLSQTLSANNELVFSEYQADIRLLSINHAYHMVGFSGEIEVTGTIVIQFDMISQTEFGDPLFIDFIPDADQVAWFPEVVSGFYPKRLERISVFNAEDLHQQLVDPNVAAKNGELRAHGKLRIKDYGTSVECGARQYHAYYVDFVVSESAAPIDNRPVSGC